VKVIVYADFNCVSCYLASQRADRLVRDGKAEVEWCAVEHRPRLPVTGLKPRPGDPGGEDDLAEAARLALHLVSPDLPTPVLHDPDPMRVTRREGGTVTLDGDPLTTEAYHRARRWRQQWQDLTQPTPAVPAVIGPGGAVHAGPDGLRCLAAIAGPDAP
jgi:hypothetical protein